MCQKPHLEKNRFDWNSQGQIPKVNSQGQIFQECVECQECVKCQECVECQGQISQGQMGNHKKTGKNRF